MRCACSEPKRPRSPGAQTEVEQEATNTELPSIDYSHIPPLRIADRYALGKVPINKRREDS